MSGRPARMPLIAGNWKMNGNHLEAIALVQKLAFTLTDKDFGAVDVVVLPPFTALRSVQTLVLGDRLRIGYGAQDVSPHDPGAYTGDISASMLVKLGCGYVLAGHSERRRYHGEDDALINAKVKALLRAELTPILCVGEDLEVRREGRQLAHVPGPGRRRAGRSAGRAGGRDGRRLRAGLGDRDRRGGHSRGRAAGVRGDPGQDFRGARGRNGRRRAYPVWRISQIG